MFEANIDGKTIKVMEIKDWKTSIERDFKPGDYFDEGITWDLINSVPPLHLKKSYFQSGEPFSSVDGKPTYITLTKVSDDPEIWKYHGACHSGQLITLNKE